MMALPLVSCSGEGSAYESLPSVKTDVSELKLEAVEDTSNFVVSANRSWNIELETGCEWIEVSTIEKLNLSGQMVNTVVSVVADENPVRENREAKLYLISETGRQEISVFQKRAKPTVDFEFAEMTRYLDPEYFSALGGKRWIKIKCNSSWTAEVDKTRTTASGVSIETESGEGDMDNFVIKVADANTDFDEYKQVVICFHMEDETDGWITLLQQKGSILTFEFMGQDCDKKNWVFEGSSPSSDNKGQGSFTTASGGYVVGYSATKSCYLFSKGFQCGDGASDYLEFPGIQGRKLIRVTLTDANGSTKPSICSSDMTVTAGGEYQSTFKSYTPISWNLTETLPGEKYRIVNGYAKTLRLNTLELEYE